MIYNEGKSHPKQKKSRAKKTEKTNSIKKSSANNPQWKKASGFSYPIIINERMIGRIKQTIIEY